MVVPAKSPSFRIMSGPVRPLGAKREPNQVYGEGREGALSMTTVAVLRLLFQRGDWRPAGGGGRESVLGYMVRACVESVCPFVVLGFQSFAPPRVCYSFSTQFWWWV